MTGEDLRALRERLHMTQLEFATWLNELMGRRYDKQKISRWETDRERLPREVLGALSVAALGVDRSPRRGLGITVAVALQKGGTAKTATAINLCYVLARAGNRVLLVDADSQGNATVHVGIPQTRVVELSKQGKTHYHALVGKSPLADVILSTDVPSLDLIPASIALAAAEAELYHEPTGINAMADMLAPMREVYDFIIIDCAPTLGMITSNALVAAQYLLIPCQTEAHAILGLEHLSETIAKIRRRSNPDLQILGIVPTMYSARQSQDRASLDDLQALWGQQARMFEPIPRSTVYSQAAAANSITLAGDPGAPGVETFVEIARSLMQSGGQLAQTSPAPEVTHGA
ncbi:AAA family ATPase [Azospirillum canadense]|uniref:AAA family ATPase n=1 Tax=Azospirillum canadense TaxID=403962 RepID=UPI002227C109|nr:AAA family ATPase [Azospirillum canadense]MCW2242563.1 cellulose biosynthesis protein BcsQ [Azospirillum canadense]